MDRLRGSRGFRAACAVALTLGLTPVQYFTLNRAEAVPAYADETVPEGAAPEIPGYLDDNVDRSQVGDGELASTGFQVVLKQTYVDEDGAKAKSIGGFFKKYGIEHMVNSTSDPVPVYTTPSDSETLVAADPGEQDDPFSMKSDVTVSIDNESGVATAVAREQIVSCDALDVTTTVPLLTPETAGAVSLSDISLTLNGAPEPLELSGSGADRNAVWNARPRFSRAWKIIRRLGRGRLAARRRREG